MQLPAGSVLRANTYVIESVLGQGGFGITYFGREVALQRPVAIKEHFPYGCQREGTHVYPGHLSDPDYQASLERFARESRLLAKFDHPSIVRVHTVFEEAGTAYLVMEYLEGSNLDQYLLEHGPLNPDLALVCLRQACEALSLVHAQGLLHRDIKPSNLILRSSQGPRGGPSGSPPHQGSRGGLASPPSSSPPHLVLIDFGSAREANLGKATAMVSVGYSPPEMYSQRAGAGPATDIYSLCATFFHLLRGEEPPDCLQRLQGVPLPALAPLSWAAVLEKGLNLTASERFQSVDEILSALDGSAPSPAEVAAPSAPAPPPAIAFYGEGQAELRGHRCSVRCLAVSPNGRFLASGGEDKLVKIWSQGNEVHSLSEHTGWVWDLAFSEDGTRLYSAGYDRQLVVWDTADWKKVASHRLSDIAQSLACWGVWMAVGTLGGKVEIRRLPDLQLERTVKLSGAVNACAFVHGELAASAGDNTVYLLNFENGEIVDRLKGSQGSVKALLTLPDGTLISGGSDRCVRRWDLERGQSEAWTGHQGTVYALARRADGGFVSGSGDKSVRCWEPGGQSRELGRHQADVSAVAVWGSTAVSAGQDNVIRIWRLP